MPITQGNKEKAMSQSNVERVIGQLVTDEAFRRQFEKEPRAAIQLVWESGLELTPYERQALACLDPDLLAHFSNAIDPRLQRIDPRGGAQ
jgi:hypothetical protein